MKAQDIEFPTELPKRWSWVRLSDLCSQDRKIVEPGSELAKHLPYLSLEHIESNTGRILRQPSDLVKDEGQSTTFAFDHRHILYGKLRPYLNKVALPNFCGRCTTELIPFLPHPNVSRNYLGWLFRHPETVAFAMKEKTGSRMPRTKITALLSLQVALPDSLEEQERIADFLAHQMNSIERAKNACLEQLELLNKLSVTLLSDFPLKVEKMKQ
jgi:type I restriction enzyme S subunit